MSAFTLDDYVERLKIIRPYTKGFTPSDGYDIRHARNWSGAQKASITRYYNLIKKFSSNKSVYVYRPRSERNRQIAMRKMGVQSYKKLKAIILQTPSNGIKPEIRITKGGDLHIDVRGTRRTLLPFEDFGISQMDFALDPDAAIEDILDELGDDYRRFTIMCGEFEVGFWQQKSKGMPQFYMKDKLMPAIQALINAYDDDKFDPHNPNSSYYGNWLRGVVGYNFNNYNQFREYSGALARYKNWSDTVNEKIRRAKVQIKIWEKEFKSLHRKRKLTKKQITRMRTIKKNIHRRKEYINDLIYSKVSNKHNLNLFN